MGKQPKCPPEEEVILLSVKNGQSDYSTMETIISAIHKLVMEEVALYADRKIKVTRKVVSKTNE